MSIVSRTSLGILCAACIFVVGTTAHAASVVWTIDSTATSLGAKATGVAPLSGLAVPARLVIQGTNPLGSATPTLPISISGSLVTDTDFTSSIKFLTTGTIEGETTGNFKPLSDLSDAAEPGDVGFTGQGKILGFFVNVVDGAIRDLALDFSGPSAIAITGGSFPTTSVSTSVIDGRIDYRGIGAIGALLGSGSESLSLLLPGDANFDRVVDGGDYTIWADNFNTGGGHQIYNGDFTDDGLVDGGDYTIWADNYLATGDPFPGVLNMGANATISIVGSNYKLTIPILSTLALTIDEGADTASTSDDISVDFTIFGNVIATTPIPSSASAVPEPSTLALSLIAGLSLAAVGFRRRLRRI